MSKLLSITKLVRLYRSGNPLVRLLTLDTPHRKINYYRGCNLKVNPYLFYYQRHFSITNTSLTLFKWGKNKGNKGDCKPKQEQCHCREPTPPKPCPPCGQESMISKWKQEKELTTQKCEERKPCKPHTSPEKNSREPEPCERDNRIKKKSLWKSKKSEPCPLPVQEFPTNFDKKPKIPKQVPPAKNFLIGEGEVKEKAVANCWNEKEPCDHVTYGSIIKIKKKDCNETSKETKKKWSEPCSQDLDKKINPCFKKEEACVNIRQKVKCKPPNEASFWGKLFGKQSKSKVYPCKEETGQHQEENSCHKLADIQDRSKPGPPYRLPHKECNNGSNKNPIKKIKQRPGDEYKVPLSQLCKKTKEESCEKEKRKSEDECERKKQEEECGRKRQEEECERRRKEEECERKKLEEECAKREKERQCEIEEKRKELECEKKRQLEECEKEKKRQEQECLKKKQEEECRKRRKEEECERKRQEEECERRRKEEECVANQKKKELECEVKMKQKAEESKRIKEQEECERRRQEEECERKRKEEECERRRKEEECEKRKRADKECLEKLKAAIEKCKKEQIDPSKKCK